MILRNFLIIAKELAQFQVRILEVILSMHDSAIHEEASESCLHPPTKRFKAATMGHPGAWICGCGATGDDSAIVNEGGTAK